MSQNIITSALAVLIYLKDFYNMNIPLINKSGINKYISRVLCLYCISL